MTPSLPEAKKQKKRMVIMDAAMKVFMEKGYDSARVSDIVREADVAKGTFYLYFESKEKVLMEIADSFLTEVQLEIVKSLEGDIYLLERIDRAIDAIAGFMEKNRDVIIFFHNSAVGSALAGLSSDDMTSMIEPAIEMIASWIGEGIEKGQVRDCDPKITAYFVIVTMHSILEQSFLSDYPTEMHEIMPELKRFIQAALEIK